MEPSLYLYGIVRAGGHLAPRGQGVDGHQRYATAEWEDLAAVVSELDHPPSGDPDDLARHVAVLQELVELAETVLPMTFGVVVPSRSELIENIVRPNADRFRKLLAALSGCVEMVVRGTYVEERLLTQILNERSDIRRLRERTRGLPEEATYYERIALGQAVAEAAAARSEQDAERIAARLRPASRSASMGQPASGRAGISRSFLVARNALGEFDRLIGALNRELDPVMRLRVRGPLPPFSFVDGQPVSAAGRG